MLRDALYRLNELYYATKDEKAEILDKLKQDNQMLSGLNKDSNDKIINTYSNLLKTTISEDSITHIFNKIIENAKLINIEEAKASVSIEQAKSAAKIEQSKTQLAKIALAKELLAKAKDTLSKGEVVKYLELFVKF